MKKSNLNDFNYLTFRAISPELRIGDVAYNSSVIIEEIEKYSNDVNLLIFPELSLTGASCGDLFFSQDLLAKISQALEDIALATAIKITNVLIGSPLLIDNNLYNVAVFISSGEIIGVVPKNIKTRHFCSIPNDFNLHKIKLGNTTVPFASDLIFNFPNLENCRIGVCLGKPDLETYSKFSDLQVIINLHSDIYSVENDTEQTIKQLSLLNNQAIIYVSSNASETTTDGVFGDKLLIAEAGKVIASTSTLHLETQRLKAEIDLDIINSLQRKLRKSSKINNNSEFICNFNNSNNFVETSLVREIPQSPYFPIPEKAKEVSMQILELQALGLAKRLKRLNLPKMVLGISGGIDSTLALLVATRTCELLDIPTTNIITITMPGFATTDRTKDNSIKLAENFGTTLLEIPINDIVTKHLEDIKHSISEKTIVYENAQARMRSLILFNYANKIGGIVVGTGDVSEIALGWSTYNADHISNYNVNAGVPKTVAQKIINAYAEDSDSSIKNILLDILETPISPELVPADDKKGISQETEKILGPYILHDFFLWYFAKFNLSSKKVKFLAENAFYGIYTSEEIDKCLSIFLKRFFTNQYKRSCSTDGVSIFDFSLSPRISGINGDIKGLVLPSDI